MPTVEELQSALDKATSESAKRIKELSDEAAANRVALKKFEGIDPDKYQEALKASNKLAEDELKKKGEYEKLLTDRDTAYAAELKKREESNANLSAKVEKFMIDNAIMSETSNAINGSQVLALLKSEYAFKVDGDNVLVSKGSTPVLGKDGHTIKIAELVTNYLGTNPHLVKPSGSGTGDRGGFNGNQDDGGDKIKAGLLKLMK